jgi:hypothetical protein
MSTLRRVLEHSEESQRATPSRRAIRLVERCSSLAAAFEHVMPKRLSVVLSTKWEVERETGLEPATFSLEG